MVFGGRAVKEEESSEEPFKLLECGDISFRSPWRVVDGKERDLKVGTKEVKGSESAFYAAEVFLMSNLHRHKIERITTVAFAARVSRAGHYRGFSEDQEGWFVLAEELVRCANSCRSKDLGIDITTEVEE